MREYDGGGQLARCIVVLLVSTAMILSCIPTVTLAELVGETQAEQTAEDVPSATSSVVDETSETTNESPRSEGSLNDTSSVDEDGIDDLDEVSEGADDKNASEELVVSMLNSDNLKEPVSLGDGMKDSVTVPDWDKYNGNAWPYGDVVYVIRSAIDKGYCVEVTNGSKEHGANVALHERNPYPQHECQQWVFRYNRENEDSTYSIYNRYSGMALDNKNSSMENRGNIVQATPNGSDAQRWYVHDVGDGTVAFQNKASGLWLDVKPDAAYDGANIQQFEFVTADNLSQHFYLTPFYDKNYDGDTTISKSVLDGQYFYLHSMQNQNLVLDVTQISTDNGALLQLCSINAGENQQFKFVANSDGTYRIVARHSGKAVEMSSLSVRSGVQLHQWADDVVVQRRWFIRQAGAQNVVAFRNLWSDLYMHVRDDDAYSGAPVEQYRYCNDDSERFVIVPVPDDSKALSVEEGVYEIVSAEDEGLVVTLDSGSVGSKLRLAASSHAANQRFRVTRSGVNHYFNAVDGGRRVAIRDGNRISGTEACLAEPESANVQRWLFDDAGGGKVLIRNGKTDLHLSVAGGSVVEGGEIVERLNTGDADQKFYLRRLDVGDADVAVISDLPYTGKDITPKPEVTFGGAALVEGEDYTLEYANNREPGTATVTIKGAGDFVGEKTVEFTIVGYDKDGWVDLSGGKKGYAKNGKLVTGWFDLEGAKYWFGDDGVMATGWTDVVVDGKTMHYYFNPASGNLVRGTWFKIDGKTYYFRPSGNLATGWATIKDNGVEKKYYFEVDGTLVTGWRDVTNDNGVTNHYYFRPSGAMATGWATIDGEKYWFRPSGNMATGWADVDDAYKRYFDSEGHMLTGWQEIEDKIYYFRPSGAMQTGTVTIDGEEYAFTGKGVLVEKEIHVSISTETVSFGQVASLTCMVDGYDTFDPDTGIPKGIVRVLWESSSDGGETWNACTNAGCDSMTMSVVATEKGVDVLYRATVTTTYGRLVSSNSAVLDIDDMVVVVTTEEVDYGGTSVLTCEVSNSKGHTLNYQWQMSENAIDWDDINGACNSAYSIVVTVEASSAQYRCVVTDDAGRVSYSEAVQLAIRSVRPDIGVSAHVQDLAWLGYVGAGDIAGTTGRGLRLEAIKIKLTDGSGKSAVTYRVHSENKGWGSWKNSDEVAGTTGRELRAEAIEVKLTGEYSNAYDVYYRVHVSDVGWIGWAKNGETAGSTGLGKAIEAVQIMLVNKGEAFNVGDACRLYKPSLTYKAHVEDVDWQSYVSEGEVAGTTGEGLRMEALKIKMPDVYGSGNAITYRAHVSDVGWMDWVPSGTIAGTTGEHKQMECVQINLTGYAASFFDIYYRVHVEDYGWLGWAKNGEMAGTTNGRRRMEAIQIELVVKGEAFDMGDASYMELDELDISARDEAVAYLRSLVGQNCCWHDSTTDCVDVAQYYYDWLGVGARSGNGCDYHTGNLPAGWTRVYSDPQPGDVAAWGSSWTSSGYGHVACVVEVNGDTITVVEQSTSARKRAGRNVPCYYATYSVNSPYSYLRPNF